MGAGEPSALHCSLRGICGVQLLEAPIFLPCFGKGFIGMLTEQHQAQGCRSIGQMWSSSSAPRSVDSPDLLQQECTCEPSSYRASPSRAQLLCIPTQTSTDAALVMQSAKDLTKQKKKPKKQTKKTQQPILHSRVQHLQLQSKKI